MILINATSGELTPGLERLELEWDCGGCQEGRPLVDSIDASFLKTESGGCVFRCRECPAYAH